MSQKRLKFPGLTLKNFSFPFSAGLNSGILKPIGPWKNDFLHEKAHKQRYVKKTAV